MKIEDQVCRWAIELQSIAQAGLYYGHDVFDRQRYQRLREIAAEMMVTKTGLSDQLIHNLFCSGMGYQTPRVSTRAAVFQEGKILLVQENSGKWVMPGGWCDLGQSPADNTVKETREEAGIDVEVCSLIAVQDRDRHNEPPYAFSIVNLFFLCRPLGGSFTPNEETLDAGYYALDDLPPLDESKTTIKQLRMCFEALHDPDWRTQFD